MIDARVARAALLIDLGRLDEADRDFDRIAATGAQRTSGFLSAFADCGIPRRQRHGKSGAETGDRYPGSRPANILTANRQMHFLVALARMGRTIRSARSTIWLPSAGKSQ